MIQQTGIRRELEADDKSAGASLRPAVDWHSILRHEVALITVKTARAGLHLLFHQRFSTGMNKELPKQCNLILRWSSNREGRRRLPASRRSGARNGSHGQDI